MFKWGDSLSEASVKFCFLVTVNIIASYIFPGNFIEVSRKIQMFTSILTILSIYWIFLSLLATEKL